MAAREINMNPDVLQDVTITTARFLLPPISSSQAALYDAAVTIYPLFYRFAVRITEQIQAAVAQHKYFGWTHIGVVYSKSAVWPLSAKLSQQLFPANGISVVASVSMTLYDPSASQTYYPQIKSAFEFLRSTKLRIFLALADTWQTMDIMMAAHRVNLVGRDYAIDDPSIHERWDTPLDASLLQGVGYIRFTTGPFFTDPYLQAWLPRFQSTVAWAVANEPQLYQDLRLNETDTTQQDHPTNFFFDDPGTNQLPSYMVLAGYDATLGMAQAFEKLISESGTTGQALANGSLTSRLTLDRMLAPLQGAKSLTGMTTFTPQGDPVVNPLTFNLFRGTALTDLGILAANITLDAATGNGVFSPDKSVFVW
ncbi:hypothetical protein HK105_201429 [Polyrhizophydium stewartii]|uniref:Receptor ligand binding region domain-containing protein n=1 Tax=Polyrhizophydium stewartii TaxID=2732419 RepID=A0ABR4NI63_9FUNG